MYPILSILLDPALSANKQASKPWSYATELKVCQPTDRPSDWQGKRLELLVQLKMNTSEHFNRFGLRRQYTFTKTLAGPPGHDFWLAALWACLTLSIVPLALRLCNQYKHDWVVRLHVDSLLDFGILIVPLHGDMCVILWLVGYFWDFLVTEDE